MRSASLEEVDHQEAVNWTSIRPLYIWKVVSATLQSGRYILLYLRRRIVATMFSNPFEDSIHIVCNWSNWHMHNLCRNNLYLKMIVLWSKRLLTNRGILNITPFKCISIKKFCSKICQFQGIHKYFCASSVTFRKLLQLNHCVQLRKNNAYSPRSKCFKDTYTGFYSSIIHCGYHISTSHSP